MKIENIRNELQTHVKPNLTIIQKEGLYPKESLIAMGKYGLYESFLQQGEKGLLQSILGIAEVSRVCMNTGFCVWCQNVLAWYLFQTSNTTLKQNLFMEVSKGQILGGTGLSNPMKSYSKLENVLLKATQTQGGFIINGTLPWVSNIEFNHIFGAVCKIDSKEYNLACIIRIYEHNSSIKLKDNISFIALEGSATKSVILHNYFVPESDILGLPAEDFLLRIATGFLLLQIGMGLGCLDLSLDLIKKSNRKKSTINAYLPISQGYIQEQRDNLLNTLEKLTNEFVLGDKEYLKAVLELRLKAGLLTLESSQSAMLHAGSSGYLANSIEYKLLLESYFVALVSPSVKHLNKELHDIAQNSGTAKHWMRVVEKFYALNN
ncbi:acyl-CoA dehydrogenase [Helicobacter didelphidarum]|uniref:Acyl-CoA dehydrogenase n=1 Tax=Helicobacter didelphidarum TaxID=2040648 RepID=A0A3D8IR96_9HELI|nr:acyl-CoA dehydrogenase family protein [Helicobacter didelphidarum]RDU67121.1 acyl-CoA dehydrogenase [Helicobacter didelphidarum]